MQARFKRFTALILSVLMVLTCMPLSAMAEDAAIPAEDISVEVIPEDAEAVPEQETATVQETEVLANQAPAEETPSVPETVPETETPQEEVPQEESAMQSEETQPAEAAEVPMLDSVYLRSSQNSQPNSDASDMNSGKERGRVFRIACSDPSPAF